MTYVHPHHIRYIGGIIKTYILLFYNIFLDVFGLAPILFEYKIDLQEYNFRQTINHNLHGMSLWLSAGAHDDGAVACNIKFNLLALISFVVIMVPGWVQASSFIVVLILNLRICEHGDVPLRHYSCIQHSDSISITAVWIFCKLIIIQTLNLEKRTYSLLKVWQRTCATSSIMGVHRLKMVKCSFILENNLPHLLATLRYQTNIPPPNVIINLPPEVPILWRPTFQSATGLILPPKSPSLGIGLLLIHDSAVRRRLFL